MSNQYKDIQKAGEAVRKAETPADRKAARAKRDELILAQATTEEHVAPVAEAAGVTTARIREITGIRKGRRKKADETDNSPVADVAQPDATQNPEGDETVQVDPADLASEQV